MFDRWIQHRFTQSLGGDGNSVPLMQPSPATPRLLRRPGLLQLGLQPYDLSQQLLHLQGLAEVGLAAGASLPARRRRSNHARPVRCGSRVLGKGKEGMRHTG